MRKILVDQVMMTDNMKDEEIKKEDEIFDVDEIRDKEKKEQGIRGNHPKSSDGWKEKLEDEDEYIRKIK